MWYRVFSLSDSPVSPAALVENLHSLALPAEPHFKGDDLGWTAGELVLPGGGTPVQLGRYLATEDDLRDDLNAHAAELETMDFSPNSPTLMRHVVQTKQLVTLRKPIDHADEATLERLCLEVVKFLAAHSDGVYQIDGQGWFAAEGALLLQEY